MCSTADLKNMLICLLFNFYEQTLFLGMECFLVIALYTFDWLSFYAFSMLHIQMSHRTVSNYSYTLISICFITTNDFFKKFNFGCVDANSMDIFRSSK